MQRACFFAWLTSDLCFQNEAHTVSSALVASGGLCRIFAYRTRLTPCVARCFFGQLMLDLCLQNEAYTVCSALFFRVAYVGSSLIERGIPHGQPACLFGWLMSDLRLQNEAQTSMQRACFLRQVLLDLCITAMALNEEGTATPGKQIKRMTRCRDIPAKRLKAMYRSQNIRAWKE